MTDRIMNAFDLFGGIALNSTKSVLKWMIIASTLMALIFAAIFTLVIYLIA